MAEKKDFECRIADCGLKEQSRKTARLPSVGQGSPWSLPRFSGLR